MDDVQKCADKLERFVAVSMELQEEYLKETQDFKRQEVLQVEYSNLHIEILTRMVNGSQ